jgi:hypothetical protein
MTTVKIKYVDEANNVVEAQAKTLQVTLGEEGNENNYTVQFKNDMAFIYLVSMFSVMTITPGAFNMVALSANKVE